MVAVVGTEEGAKSAMKMKTDLKKPITGLACHPRGAILVHIHLVQLFRILAGCLTAAWQAIVICFLQLDQCKLTAKPS